MNVFRRTLGEKQAEVFGCTASGAATMMKVGEYLFQVDGCRPTIGRSSSTIPTMYFLNTQVVPADAHPNLQ